MLRIRKAKPAAPTTDAELLARFRASGRADDLLPLYERYAELIYALALRYLGSPQRAEDAGMELWSVLLEKLPRHEVANFRAWLHTTVRNHCLMQLRRERRDPLQHSTDDLVQSARLTHLPDGAGDVDTRPLYRCLRQLNELQGRCVRLFYLQEGHSYQSIAALLDLSVGQVRSHLQNGRRNLKICLQAQPPATEE